MPNLKWMNVIGLEKKISNPVALVLKLWPELQYNYQMQWHLDILNVTLYINQPIISINEKSV